MFNVLGTKKNSSKGSLLLEVIIVVSIISISIMAAMSVAEKSIALSRQSIHQAQASFLLEEGAEVMRILRDGDWANVSSLSLDTDYYANFDGVSWGLSATPSQLGIFTRTITVSNALRDANQDLSSSGTADADTRLITIEVSWQEGSQTISKTIQFYLANIFS